MSDKSTLHDPDAFTTASGHTTITRTATLEDLPAVNAMHSPERCSFETRADRYNSPLHTITTANWWHLTDPTRGVTWVTSPADAPEQIIAVTHLLRYADEPDTLDLAILIEDAWQNLGLGSALTLRALTYARDHHYRRIRAEAAACNRRVRGIVQRVGATMSPVAGSVVEMHMDITP